MARRKRSISLHVILASVTVALSLALLVGWILLILRNWELTQVTQDVWLLVAGIISFVVIMTVLVLFVIFLAREILEVRRQDSFIDSVTHELKSPLASLLLMVQTLQRHHLDEERRGELLDMMADDIDRISVFVDDVLVASRVAFGKTTYRVVDVNLHKIIEQCITRVSKRYKLESGRVSAQVASDLDLKTDETLLEVILNNLLDNAVKYSDRPVEVHVEVSRSAPTKIQINVSDNGIGIPKASQKRVFDRFYRVPGEEVNKRRGTGLGLFVVASLVKSLDGQVKASDGLKGRGTTMSVVLPTDKQVVSS